MTAVGYDLGVPVVDDLGTVIDECDVIIDFSTKEMAMEVVKLAIEHKKALVCGTTGFSAEEFSEFEKAAEFIPMLYAANTSKLVNVMNKLLELVAKTVGEELDIEILEMHDQWKKDAPSGTSKEMGEVKKQLVSDYLNAQIGKPLNVLFETCDKDGIWCGHTENYVKVYSKNGEKNTIKTIVPTGLYLDGLCE